MNYIVFLKSQILNIASFVTFYRATSSQRSSLKTTFYRATSSQITSLKSVTLMYRCYGFSAKSKILNFDLNFLFCDNLLP